MDIESLLAEVSPDSPCGPDLEYDPDFIALEQAARGKPEQQFGDTVVPAEEPDWIQVKKQAEALLSRTKDLRVAMLFTRALTCLEGASGLASGLQLTEQLLARQWSQLHPQLDPDDGDDPTMRLNALAPLADPETLLRDVRNMSVVGGGRFSRLSLRSILVALEKLPAAANEPVVSQAEIESTIRAVAADNPASVTSLRDALRTVGALYAFLGEKVGYDHTPDVKPLTDLLKPVAQLFDSVLGTGAEPAATTGEEEQVENAWMPREPSPAGLTGEIRSREDAVRMLEKVCEFMERTEPANPAPLFIRRAQRLMTKSFVEIIQELAPDSLDQIQRLTGFNQ
jgi:type VI secretion system protein ImpA